MYNIPFANIAIIFEKHQLNELYFTMLLPDTVFDSNNYVFENRISNSYYYVELDYRGDPKNVKLRFSTKDGNPVYCHSFANLRLYATTTSIFTPVYTITIEILEKIGICYLFRAVKNNYISPCFRMNTNICQVGWCGLDSSDDVTFNKEQIAKLRSFDKPVFLSTMNSSDEFARYNLGQYGSKGLIAIPDLTLMLKRNRPEYDRGYVVKGDHWYDFLIPCNKRTRTLFKNVLVIPQSIYDACLYYSSTTRFETFTPTEFATYLKGKMNSVVFEDHKVQAGWRPSPEEFEKTLVSLYVLLCMKKNAVNEDQKQIKAIFQSEAHTGGFINEIIEIFKKWKMQISRKIPLKALTYIGPVNLLFSYGLYIPTGHRILDVHFLALPPVPAIKEGAPVPAKSDSDSDEEEDLSTDIIASTPMVLFNHKINYYYSNVSMKKFVTHFDFISSAYKHSYVTVEKGVQICKTLSSIRNKAEINAIYNNATHGFTYVNGEHLITVLRNHEFTTETIKTITSGIKTCLDANNIEVALAIPANNSIVEPLFLESAFNTFDECHFTNVRGVYTINDYYLYSSCFTAYVNKVKGDGHCLLHAYVFNQRFNYNDVIDLLMRLNIQDHYFKNGEKVALTPEQLQPIVDVFRINAVIHADLSAPIFIKASDPVGTTAIYWKDGHFDHIACKHNCIYGGGPKRGSTPKIPKSSPKDKTNIIHLHKVEHNLFTVKCGKHTKNSVPTKIYSTFNSNKSITKFSVYDKIKRLLEIKKYDYYYEMSCAPGGLYKDLCKQYGDNVTGYIYNGDNALTSELKLQNYKDIKTVLGSNIQANSLLIFDVPFEMSKVNLYTLMEFYNGRKNIDIIVKCHLWDEASSSNIQLVKLLGWADDDSYAVVMQSIRTGSSELYILITHSTIKIDNADYVNKQLNKWGYYTNDILNDNCPVVTKDFVHTVKIKAGAIKDYLSVPSDITQINDVIKAMQVIAFADKGVEFDVKINNAVPGAGKSRGINADDNTLIITTTQTNREDLKRNRKCIVETPHNALSILITKKFSKIVIDEYQEYAAGLIAMYYHFCKNLEFVGDHNQIKFIDFSRKMDMNLQALNMPNDYTTNASKRCPADIAIFWRNKGINMVSKGKQTRSIYECYKVQELNSCDITIAPTQFTKAKYNCTYTIHESKGLTAAVVGLVIESAEDYSIMKSNKIEHWFVSTTRHTDALLFFEPNRTADRVFQIMTAGLMSYLDNMPIMSTSIAKEPTTTALPETNKVVKEKGSLKCLQETLSNNLPKRNQDMPVVDMINPGSIPSIYQGKLRVNVDLLAENNKKKTGKSFLKGFEDSYTKFYNVTDRMAAVQTMGARYAKMTPKVTTNVNRALDLYWHGLLKFTKFESVTELRNHFYSGPEELAKECQEYLQRLHKKLNETNKNDPTGKEFAQIARDEGITLNNKKVDAILNTTFDDIKMHIDFFMKQQSKYIDQAGWDAVFKAGQGVSAVSKVMNIIMAAVSRLTLQKLQTAHKHNVKITTKESIASFKNWYVAHRQGKKPNKIIMADASQWDASNSMINILFDAQMFACVLFKNLTDEQLYISHDYCNTPKPEGIYTHWVINKYVESRRNWEMIYVTKGGSAVLKGKEKQHSGQQHTLGGNSANNEAQMGAILDIQELDIGMFQGDDSNVEGDVSVNMENLKFLRSLGWNYKIAESDTGVGEYCGYILHPTGWIPDLMKRCAKTLSKSAQSKEKFDESIKGLRDTLSVVSNQTEKENGISASLIYFQNYTNMTKVSRNEIDNAFNWLNSIDESSYSALHPRTTEILQL